MLCAAGGQKQNKEAKLLRTRVSLLKQPARASGKAASAGCVGRCLTLLSAATGLAAGTAAAARQHKKKKKKKKESNVETATCMGGREIPSTIEKIYCTYPTVV